jgi:hypothetical protein
LFGNDTIIKVKGGVIVRLGDLTESASSEKQKQKQNGDSERGEEEEEVPNADRRLMRVNTSLLHPDFISNAD